MWHRLALFCLRRALRHAEARVRADSIPVDRRLSLELDSLRIAIEALERVSVDRGGR